MESGDHSDGIVSRLNRSEKAILGRLSAIIQTPKGVILNQSKGFPSAFTSETLSSWLVRSTSLPSSAIQGVLEKPCGHELASNLAKVFEELVSRGILNALARLEQGKQRKAELRVQNRARREELQVMREQTEAVAKTVSRGHVKKLRKQKLKKNLQAAAALDTKERKSIEALCGLAVSALQPPAKGESLWITYSGAFETNRRKH